MTKFALDIPGAAEACSVAPTLIRAAIHSGALPAKKAGRSYRIKVTDLETWFDGLEDA
jgi:excisionase family DNA binding protein